MEQNTPRTYEQIRDEANAAGVEFQAAKARYDKLRREAKEAGAQERFGVPYRISPERSFGGTVNLHLTHTGPKGRLLYSSTMGGRQNNWYVVREADGTMSGILGRKPTGKWTEIQTVTPGLKYVW